MTFVDSCGDRDAQRARRHGGASSYMPVLRPWLYPDPPLAAAYRPTKTGVGVDGRSPAVIGSVWVHLDPGDWRPPESAAGGQLHMQVISLAVSGSADPEWVYARGWWMANVEDEMPELAEILVRYNALPEHLQARLPKVEDGDGDQ